MSIRQYVQITHENCSINMNNLTLSVFQILATYSTVFYAMFYGDFDERNKKEIELKDVNREVSMIFYNKQ